MIVDAEEGESRFLSIDDSGIVELSLGTLDEVADEVTHREPDLILVNPGALEMAGYSLVNELNRLARFQPSYTWDPAPGELPN
jgi:hypothetical protein